MLMTSLLGVEVGGLPDGEAQSVALVQQKLRGNFSGKRSAALDSQQVGVLEDPEDLIVRFFEDLLVVTTIVLLLGLNTVLEDGSDDV